jgi:multicomponent Na+:H+ antiporter subunit E
MIAILIRAAAFAVLWVLLAGVHSADLPAAALAVAAATWASLRLLPARKTLLSPAGLAGLALRFPLQALWAGADVAWRAAQPRLMLRPGFVVYRPILPAGQGRDAFAAFASLLPGMLPADTTPDGDVLVHCLDTEQPIVAELAREERRFVHALGHATDHG